MHIKEILEKNKIAFSFEFFPPKDKDSSGNLFKAIKELNDLEPSYVSVTFGAGGSTRDLTHDLVVKIQQETNLTVVSHLTCVGSSKDEIFNILDRYQKEGIQNIMALRGDPPHGYDRFVKTEGGFQYATELVQFIKENFPTMGIGVAAYPEGHPETPNRLIEIEHLKDKVEAGADYICTQMFFDNHNFYDFRERCRIEGITIPILAGIMPITSKQGMRRMADLALGSHYPPKLIKSINRADDKEAVKRVGAHWATEQVLDLIDNNVEGIHFYTLNQSQATREIYTSLGVKNSHSFNR